MKEKQKQSSPPGGRARGGPRNGAGDDGKYRRKNGARYSRPHTFETKLRAVKLYLEEGMPLEVVAGEADVLANTLRWWVQNYRRRGEAGLQGYPGCAGGRTQVAPTVKARIVAVKKTNPGYGVERISQLLKRLFLMKASPETVRKTLHKEKLIEPKRRKPAKNPPKPRFFERSTPNQLWQSDIFSFRLGGENAYLIGFIDDHSRYITALGVYRGQTADNVLETYRRARGEYGPPKEMLTDNGRQYTCWRGKTKFEQEMQRDRIHHFRSQPHHPMTLGKIERFWKSIWEEFLEKAKFDSFESAQERIAYWVKYYNHKRPHQGIGGECPADRFFKIRKEMKDAIAKGVEENVQELAVRGEPKSPFYMVGRMGGKSVVISAERGQVKMQVEGDEEKILGGLGNDSTGKDDDNDSKSAEARKGVHGEGEGTGSAFGVEREKETIGGKQDNDGELGGAEHVGKVGDNGDPAFAGSGGTGAGGTAGLEPGQQAGEASDNTCAGEGRAVSTEGGIIHDQTQCAGEGTGGSVDMGGETESAGSLPGNGSERGEPVPVAGGSDGGYAACVGTEVERREPLPCSAAETEEAPGAESDAAGGTATPVGEAARETAGDRGEPVFLTVERISHGRRDGTVMGGEDNPGAERQPDGIGGSQAAQCEPEDLPQASEGVAPYDAQHAYGKEDRAPAPGKGRAGGILAQGGVEPSGAGWDS